MIINLNKIYPKIILNKISYKIKYKYSFTLEIK